VYFRYIFDRDSLPVRAERESHLFIFDTFSIAFFSVRAENSNVTFSIHI
jgi:hypothetical protein